MARQKTYSNDPNIQGADRLTGVRSENSNTANYSIDDIADFLANTGNADGSRLGWRYDYGGEYDPSIALQPGKMYIEFLDNSQTKDFSNIRTIYFKNESKDNHSIVPMRQHLAGGILKLANTSTPEQRDYAIYRVTTSAAVAGKTDETFMTLIHIDSDGTFGADELVISVFQSGIGVESEGVVLRSGTELPEGNEVGLQGDFYIQYEIIDELDDVPLRLFGPKASSNGAADWGDGVSMRGLAATLNVGTTETLDPGEEAVVTQEGTNTDRIFNFEIPRGEKGEDGDPGADGIDGTDGVDGTDGNDGLPGTDGTDGTDGVDGTDGRNIRFGESPPTNDIGVNGEFYLETDSYILWGPKEGGQWLPTNQQLLIGAAGSDGANGADGADGTDGTNGTDGLPGADGRTILNGELPPVDTEGSPGDYFFDTAADMFYGPKDTDDTWDLDKVIDLSPPTASFTAEQIGDVDEDDVQIVYDGLDCIKFTGSGISSVVGDGEGCVTVTIAGGGGAVIISQIEDLAIADNDDDWDTNSFPEIDQTLNTLRVTWTNPDTTNIKVSSLVISADEGDFDTITENTEANLNDASETIDNTVTFDAGTDGTVTLTATLTYTDEDLQERVVTADLVLSTSAVDPVVLVTETFNTDFLFAPENRNVELYDTGTIAYSSEVTSDGWDAPTEVLSLQEGSQGTVSGKILTVDGDDNPLAVDYTSDFVQTGGDAVYQDVAPFVYNRIRSFRYGFVVEPSANVTPTFTDDDDAVYGLHSLGAFNGANRTIDYGNLLPTAPIFIMPDVDVNNHMYFVFDTGTTVTAITDGYGSNLLDIPGVLVHTENVGGYDVYIFDNPAGEAISNKFTIT